MLFALKNSFGPLVHPSTLKVAGRSGNWRIRLLCGAAICLVAGCGVTYQSPKVRPNSNDGDVQVITLTATTLPQANAVDYTPRSLPVAFFQAPSATAVSSVPDLPRQPTGLAPEPVALQLRLPPAQSPQPYKIGVGDVLDLTTKQGSTPVDGLSEGLLSARNQHGYTVRDDGAISIPGIGAVVVAGLSLDEAEARLFDVLVDHQINPAFSLSVSEFKSQRIALGGAVGSPTVLPVALKPPTLAEAVAAAGGVTAKNRAHTAIRLYRQGDLFEIPLNDYLKRADLQKLTLNGGDAVFVDETYDLEQALTFFERRIDVINSRRAARAAAVAELKAEIGLRQAALHDARETFRTRVALDAVPRDFVYVTGEVVTQRRFPLPFGRQANLADVLFSDGGVPTETANLAHVYVLRTRAGEQGVIAWHLNAANPANLLLGTRFEMRPNDVVFIEEQPITKWSRALEQFLPPLVSVAGD